MYQNRIADLQLLQHATCEPLLVHFASPVREVKLVRNPPAPNGTQHHRSSVVSPILVQAYAGGRTNDQVI